MAKFTHYLVTRFNVPIEQWGRDKKGLPTLDDAWMEHRLNLFARFCVPTVAGQTEKNFKWIIYCDENSGELSLDRIYHLIPAIPETTVRLVVDYNQMLNDIKLLILNSSTRFVITSRVDNDDGLGKHYIRDVQRAFVEKDNVIINLNGGILYDEEKKILTEIRRGRLNHYTSLIEEIKPADNLVSIMGYPHDRPPADYQIIERECRYSWLKIIHSRNLSSRTHGKPVSLKEVLSHFAVDPGLLKVSEINTWTYAGKKLLEVLRRKLTNQ